MKFIANMNPNQWDLLTTGLCLQYFNRKKQEMELGHVPN